MKNYQPFYLLIMLMISLANCTGKEQSQPPENDLDLLESKVPSTRNIVEKVDTLLAPNAPGWITRKIIQDQKGNIWFATWDGIIQYDGSSFTNVTKDIASHFFAVLEDRQGNLWFGSLGSGVFYYDGVSLENFTTNEGLVNDRVTNIYEDKKGHIWFGTEGGVSRYDGKSFQNFTTQDGLTNNDVNSIVEDQFGNFWFGTRGDACIYDGTHFTPIKDSSGKPFENVRSIIEDRKGHIWLGGDEGLWRYSNSSFTQIATEFVGYIYEDKQGAIWTTTEGDETNWQLSRYKEDQFKNQMIVTAPIKPKGGMLFGFLEDQEGHIWFGTLNGVCRYNGNAIHYFQGN